MKKLLLFCFLTTGCAVLDGRFFQSYRMGPKRGLAEVNQALALCKTLKAPRVKKTACKRLAETDAISNLALSLCEKLWNQDEQKMNCLLESAAYRP